MKLKIGLKDKKKLMKQINGQLKDVSIADENKFKKITAAISSSVRS